jgi:uncharacterized protein YdhG (YjbR/CyaY superfamily)
MNLKKARPQNVDDYIAVAPEAAQRKLHEMRACIAKAAPGAEETLKYGMPAYCYQRILVIFGGFKQHIGFYPTGRAMLPFAKELAKFKKSRGAVQFPLDQPLPLALIRKIVAERVRLSIEKDGKWKTAGQPEKLSGKKKARGVTPDRKTRRTTGRKA